MRIAEYTVLAVAVALALAVRFAWTAGGSSARSPSQPEFRGTTDEGERIAVLLTRSGRVEGLRTALVGICENGGRYRIGWDPTSPNVSFRVRERTVIAREVSDQTSSAGVVSVTAVSSTVRVHGRLAEGDARFRTTFRYPSGRLLRCDSGYVRWAANRAGTATPTSGLAGTYPVVTSLAGRPSKAQRDFARVIDGTCASTYNENQQLQRAREANGEPPRERREAAVDDHRRQYRAIAKWGNPPVHATLYRAWLANMRERIELEALAAHEERRLAARTYGRIEYLKVEGDSLGQRFGLTVCTSNGPLRQTIR